ncbi:hypothetical protein [Marinigracilibium pacificum]|uniref:Sodium/proton-translocating pyrophosphatase n=1 Tax=Marinigracilibium pacificum TaxID=2729599 RepID=A0A848IYM6_9BACT|nr:hypothetical protein [Marinigracilibium pacificum]NMM47400.1 sodium/proton-translocating pyrophosphatase [Marinigracilibium pacificum]
MMFEEWTDFLMISGLIFLTVSAIIIGYHVIKVNFFLSPKKAYEYISRYEVRTLEFGSYALIIAGAFFINTLFPDSKLLWWLVRIFLTVMAGLILSIVIKSYLKYYYPFHLEKRLKRLRYKPRVSPKTGRKMKLLSEEEEDVYLDEGMQTEENVYSVDYDVWIDEATGYTIIEKYQGHMIASRCPECNYNTFKVEKEDLIKPPSLSTEGKLIKTYKCRYCGHEEKKTFPVAKLTENHS